MIPRGKRPAIANGHLKATVDKDFLTETFKPYGRPFNIGIVPGLGGLFVLDVDPEDGGMEALPGLNLPPTLRVNTPSGGLHLYFRPTAEQLVILDDDGGSTNSGIGPGLDTRFSRGYVVAPGSFATAPYAFDVSTVTNSVISETGPVLDLRPLFACAAPMPPDLLDRVVASRSREAAISRSSSEGAIDGVIENPGADFESVLAGCDFMRFCMENPAATKEPRWHAALSIVGRCRDGRKLAHDLSRGHPEYNDHDTDKKLDHAVKRPPRTCHHIQHGLGFDCSRCPFRDHDRMKSPYKLAFQQPKDVRIIKRHIVGPGSQHIDGETGKVVSRQDADDALRVDLGNQPHLAITESEIRVKVDAIAYLAGDDNLITRNEKGDRAVNIWRPGGAEECEGDAETIINHFTHLIPDQEERRHVLDYIAHSVQQPSVKIRHAVVLSGPQGTGKSAVAKILAALFGARNVTTIGGEGVLKRFNHRMVNTQIAVIEEANNGSRLEATDMLKEWLSAETISAERKRLDEFDGYTPRAVFVNSNHTAPFVIEKGARRWFFPQTTKVIASPAYFKALWRPSTTRSKSVRSRCG